MEILYIVPYHTAPMIELRRSEQCNPYCVNVTCATSTSKQHVTRVSADLALTYERDGTYVDIKSGYARVSCFSLSTSRT